MNQDLDKWLILGLGYKINSIRMDHLTEPKSKKVLREQWHSDGDVSEGYSHLKGLPMAKAGTWEQQK